MRKQVRLTATDAPQPVKRLRQTAVHTLVLAGNPFGKVEINLFHHPTQCCLLHSAKLNGHELFAYLKDVLTRLPTQLNSRIEELLPHRWQPAS